MKRFQQLLLNIDQAASAFVTNEIKSTAGQVELEHPFTEIKAITHALNNIVTEVLSQVHECLVSPEIEEWYAEWDRKIPNVLNSDWWLAPKTTLADTQLHREVWKWALLNSPSRMQQVAIQYFRLHGVVIWMQGEKPFGYAQFLEALNENLCTKLYYWAWNAGNFNGEEDYELYGPILIKEINDLGIKDREVFMRNLNNLAFQSTLPFKRLCDAYSMEDIYEGGHFNMDEGWWVKDGELEEERKQQLQEANEAWTLEQGRVSQHAVANEIKILKNLKTVRCGRSFTDHDQKLLDDLEALLPKLQKAEQAVWDQSDEEFEQYAQNPEGKKDPFELMMTVRGFGEVKARKMLERNKAQAEQYPDDELKKAGYKTAKETDEVLGSSLIAALAGGPSFRLEAKKKYYKAMVARIGLKPENLTEPEHRLLRAYNILPEDLVTENPSYKIIRVVEMILRHCMDNIEEIDPHRRLRLEYAKMWREREESSEESDGLPLLSEDQELMAAVPMDAPEAPTGVTAEDLSKRIKDFYESDEYREATIEDREKLRRKLYDELVVLDPNIVEELLKHEVMATERDAYDREILRQKENAQTDLGSFEDFVAGLNAGEESQSEIEQADQTQPQEQTAKAKPDALAKRVERCLREASHNRTGGRLTIKAIGAFLTNATGILNNPKMTIKAQTVYRKIARENDPSLTPEARTPRNGSKGNYRNDNHLLHPAVQDFCTRHFPTGKAQIFYEKGNRKKQLYVIPQGHVDQSVSFPKVSEHLCELLADEIEEITQGWENEMAARESITRPSPESLMPNPEVLKQLKQEVQKDAYSVEDPTPEPKKEEPPEEKLTPEEQRKKEKREKMMRFAKNQANQGMM